jgi:hypothetical protein
VEENAVLVVREGVVYFLVPYDTTVGGRHIHQLDPYSIADQIIRQHGGPLESRIRPSVPVRVGNVQFGNGNCEDLVRGLGHGALDRDLVIVGEN